MASSSILFCGGILLVHSADDTVVPTRADLLVTGNIITSIALSIDPPPGAEIIDCTNKLISPGFVDTHRHMWNTALKGRHANEVLKEYIFSGAAAAAHFTPEDTFWSQLSGCLETIDAGAWRSGQSFTRQYTDMS